MLSHLFNFLNIPRQRKKKALDEVAMITSVFQHCMIVRNINGNKLGTIQEAKPRSAGLGLGLELGLGLWLGIG